MSVKAKFVCNGITEHPDHKQQTVNMIPVVSGSEENKSFAKYTPAGSLSLCISEETNAYGYFKAGKEYLLTLEEA